MLQKSWFSRVRGEANWVSRNFRRMFYSYETKLKQFSQRSLLFKIQENFRSMIRVAVKIQEG